MGDVNQDLNHELNIVYRYLLKQGIAHVDAEDIVQETAYKYLLFNDSIQPAKTRSWLIRVALNFHYDQCRKLRRIELNMENEQHTSNSEEQPEAAILTKENRNELGELLSRLKPQYQELLLLKYQSGLSYQEIAQLLGISVSSVKTNLFRARQRLAKVLKEAAYDRE
ncbi:RNA polymerase sigma factor [Mesobacillus sp. S13]|uniref:RNA polymerase sigma factor n=1 Tax=Mesobacillus sp. S13 TaxID=2880221 RepID=UPI001CF52EF7|nr:sigma-70 family RNA polymerase sigma factor [Mesobacillus sp. S13]